MRHVECSRCGREITNMGRRDERGGYVHSMPCPPAPEPYVAPVYERPFTIRLSMRAFCRKSDHNACSGVTVTGERIAQVCVCGCHHPESPEHRR